MQAATKEQKKPNIEKAEKVEAIKEKFSKSKVVILTEHMGLSVFQITKLRKNLRKVNAEYRVYKNTLTSIGLKGKDAKELDEILNGPNAFIFGYDDPIAPVKILSSFIKENEKPRIKGGLLGSIFINESAVKALAKLPSREVLLARVVGGIQAPISRLVNVLHGSFRKIVYALSAVRDKKEKQL